MAKERKPIWKRWWFWILIIIIIGIASCGGGDEDTGTEQQVEEQGDTSAKEEETKEELLSVGQPVKTGDFEYVVKGSSETNEIKSDNQFIDSKTTTGKFIVVDYSVKNLDSEARMVDAGLFRIKSGGNEFKPMQDGDIMMLLGDANLFLEEVNPQMSREGKIVFEVPADLATYDLQLSSGLGWSGGEYKTVKLK
ncbi:DUF4352 domain-containing protein [Niallia sp. Krafla_26]|uniref:DUF4352 domain-containing protein n=1 Tax=Niallia sp. Krafla_26 TaxID=3064703 RepID=UPI003D18278B